MYVLIIGTTPNADLDPELSPCILNLCGYNTSIFDEKLNFETIERSKYILQITIIQSSTLPDTFAETPLMPIGQTVVLFNLQAL